MRAQHFWKKPICFESLCGLFSVDRANFAAVESLQKNLPPELNLNKNTVSRPVPKRPQPEERAATNEEGSGSGQVAPQNLRG